MKRIVKVKKVPDDVFPAPEPWVCGRAWTASAITIIHCGKHYYRKQETVFLGQCPKFRDSPQPQSFTFKKPVQNSLPKKGTLLSARLGFRV